MGNYRPEIGYEVTLLFAVAILAAFAATILHYLGEASNYGKLYLIHGNATNTAISFNALDCAAANYEIVLVTFVSALIISVPIVIVGHRWMFGKLGMDLRKYLTFPAVAIGLHLVYVFFFAYEKLNDSNCLVSVNPF